MADLTPLYSAAGGEWNIDPALLQSIAQQESSENPNTRDSSAGAQGLMQFMPGTAAQVGGPNFNPRDPVQAVYGAAKLMSGLLDKYQRPELALAAYNAGEPRVDAYLAGRGSLPAETQAYIPSVTQKYLALAGRQNAAGQAQNPPGNPSAPSAVQPPSPNAPSQAASPSPASMSDSDLTNMLTAGAAPPPAAHMSDDALTNLLTGGASAPGGQRPLSALSDDDLVKALTAGGKPGQAGGSPTAGNASAASTAPLVAPHPNPDGSPGMTNLSDADYYAFNGGTPSRPVTPVAAPTQSAHPILDAAKNLASGAYQGGEDVAHSINSAAAYVDKNVPVLASIDRAFGANPARDAAAQEAERQAYEASPAGQSTAGGIGRFVGQTGTSALLTAPIGGALAAGGRLVGAGANALLPSASATVADAGNALMGNRLAAFGVNRALVPAAAGATYGGAQGALTASANPDQSLGQAIGTNALYGGMLAPGAAVGISALKGLGRTGSAVASMVRNKLNPGAAINNDVAQIVAQSGGPAGQGMTNALPSRVEPTMPQPTGAQPPVIPGRIEPTIVQPPGPPQPSPSTVVPPYASRVASTNQLAAGAPPAPPPAAPPQIPRPAPSIPAPAPGSMGAAATTPANLAANAMTGAQAEASRATGFNYRLSQQAAPGYDATPYVLGVRPTAAEISASPELAAKQRVISPGDADFAARDRANNEARLDFFDNIAGTPTTVQTLKDARAVQAETDLAAAFSNKKPVDAQPVVDQINSMLASRDGKIKPVADALADAASALQKSNGTGLETDPEMLYGARQHVAYLLSKTAQQDKPGMARATQQLQTVKDALDQVIEPGAPGYRQYLANYAEASKPIDAQETLQGYRPNLLSADGSMRLGLVNTMMKSIGQKMSAPGVNPAKSLTDDQVNALFDLRQDLLRQNNRNLQRAPGSDTVHNLSVVGDIAAGAAHAGAHIVASHVPGGNLVLGAALNSAANGANARARAALKEALLNPPGQ